MEQGFRIDVSAMRSSSKLGTSKVKQTGRTSAWRLTDVVTPNVPARKECCPLALEQFVVLLQTVYWLRPNVNGQRAPTACRAGQQTQNGAQPERLMAGATAVGAQLG